MDTKLTEFKWPWQRKKVKPKPKSDPTEVLDIISVDITKLYCHALNHFLDRIIDEVAKKEGVNKEDIRDALAVGYSLRSKEDYYKKHKQVFDREYKQALFNLIKVMPQIKQEMKRFIDEYKKIPTSKTRYYKDQALNYIKLMKVDNRKFAKDVISFNMITSGKGMPSEEPHHISQSYSYCMSDY